MSPPDTKQLKSVIVDIVSRARRDGRLNETSVRTVRQELATHFNLEEDVLKISKYKSFIKETVYATIDSLDNASSEPRRASKKDKLDSKSKSGTRKSGLKVIAPTSDEEPQEADMSEGEAPPPKASVRSKPSKSAIPNKSKNMEHEMKYKSKAIIESSDEEVAPDSSARKAARPPKKGQTPLKSSPPKLKQKENEDSSVEMDTIPGPSSSISEPKHSTNSSKTSASKAKELPKDPIESELSSVIDEPPKKRLKKQEKKSNKIQKDEKAKRGKKETLSKEEETVNKLKGIVVACGVRKVWKRELEGLNKPSQQIKRLHSILGELGMTPRYSLEKAKGIRERRELAQELKDVQEFEKAVKKRRREPRSSPEIAESADPDESDVGVPARKKLNARASIMAFLQDQSEEE